METKVIKNLSAVSAAIGCLCIMAGPFAYGQTTVLVPSTQNFTDSGIFAMGGEVYQIETTGTVDLAVPDTYKTDPNGTIVTAPATGSGAYQFFQSSAVPTGEPPVVGGRKLVARENWLAYGPQGALVAGYIPPLDELARTGYPETFRVVDGSGPPPPRPNSGGDFFLGINLAASGFAVQGSYGFVATLNNGGSVNGLAVPGAVYVIPESQGLVETITAPLGLVDSAPADGRYVTRPDGVIQAAPPAGTPAYGYFVFNTAPIGVAPMAGETKHVLPRHHRQMVPYGALVAGWSKTANPTSYGDFPLGFEFVGSSRTITAPPGGGFLFFGVNDFFIRGTSDNAGAYEVTVSQVEDSPTVNAAIQLSGFGGGAAITSGGFVEIYGVNLSDDNRIWSNDDFVDGVAPTALAGVKVLIDGKPAFIYFVSPTQINCIAPDGLAEGEVDLTITKGESMSAAYRVPVAARAPALLAPPEFVSGGRQLAVGILPDGSYVGPAELIPGAAFRPAAVDDRVVFYGIGFGEGEPAIPAGSIAAEPTSLPNVEVLMGNVPAEVEYAGLTPGNVGLYQLNIVVPPGATGLVRLTVSIDEAPVEQELWILVE